MSKILDEFFKQSLSYRVSIIVTLWVMAFLIGYDGGAILDGKMWEVIPDVSAPLGIPAAPWSFDPAQKST